MIKVQFRTRSAGPSGVIKPGDVISVPEHEAELLVRARYAQYVEQPTPGPHVDASGSGQLPALEAEIEADAAPEADAMPEPEQADEDHADTLPEPEPTKAKPGKGARK